jgi:hypothetical protein
MGIPYSNPNLAQFIAAATRLSPLLDQIAFVGGCVTGLLLTDPAAAPVRPTLDVDAITAISSYTELTLLESRLRDLGFHQPHAEGAPICRWKNGALLLDLMPTDSSILGFTNRWCPPAFAHAQKLEIGEYEIRVITAPYFLATKLEAFMAAARTISAATTWKTLSPSLTDGQNLSMRSISLRRTCRNI